VECALTLLIARREKPFSSQPLGREVASPCAGANGVQEVALATLGRIVGDPELIQKSM
jgi:hypothetical protein